MNPAPPLPMAIDAAKLRDICERFRIAELSVFGSILRPDFRPDSDVDFMVEFKPDARIGLEFVDLKFELEALVGRRVDLVTKRSLREHLRDRILASSRVLHVA